MTGQEAIEIVDRLGLSQRQFALLTGMHPQAMTKWTHGSRPSAMAVTMLRLLERRPELIEVLREIAGVGPGEKVRG